MPFGNAMRARSLDTPPTPFAHILETTRALDEDAKESLTHSADKAKVKFIEFLTSQGVDAYYIERVETIEATTLVGWLDGGLDLLIKNLV